MFKAGCLCKVHWQEDRISWCYVVAGWKTRCPSPGDKFIEKVSYERQNKMSCANMQMTLIYSIAKWNHISLSLFIFHWSGSFILRSHSSYYHIHILCVLLTDVCKVKKLIHTMHICVWCPSAVFLAVHPLDFALSLVSKKLFQDVCHVYNWIN